MQLKWNKCGLVFPADGQSGWMKSHAQVPSAVVIGDTIRVFFAARPQANLSLTTFVDLDAREPQRIVRLNPDPILLPGPPGTFDEHGIMPQHAVALDSGIKLFYAGWSRRTSIPYSNWVGLATAEAGADTFTKAFDAPVLDRIPGDIFSATGLYCMRHGDGWVGWYASGTEWMDSNDGGGLSPLYEIRQCRSNDLIHWSRNRRPIFSTKQPREANTRPAVLHVGNRWLMWFCYRSGYNFRDGSGSYRIGFAWSEDLECWYRNDELAGIDVSSSGWDSTMIAYPNIVRAMDQYLMFYNGNGFGLAGFGLAAVSVDEMTAFAASLVKH